ncbi:MAG: sugar phosphorylase [Chloroflexota bacterium]
MKPQKNSLSHLIELYGNDLGRATLTRLATVLDKYRGRIPPPRAPGLTARDAILITYGDQVRAPHQVPLRTLADFCATHLRDVVSGVHILPFYPYSSDDGFSVLDYRVVNPALGSWEDIARLRQNFRLMFDLVANHVSAQSEWFQEFLRGDSGYADYFIRVPEGADLSQVVRPRALPVLTQFATPSGIQNVWTTFSADQIDLNYRNPDVLIEIIDVLLSYVARGAEFIRLDAIAFLWKEFGTPCLHLPQTHRIIQLLRAVLDEIAPHVMLITETNVPHQDNLAYFGDGANEAQMVYNFALPPLTLHAFHTSDASTLSRWASALTLPSTRVTFFNFLASHDGIGLTPARGILSDAELGALVARARTHGGFVSNRNNPDGTTSPYELNINLFDALNDPHAPKSLETQVDRFIAAQAIMLAFVGVPGIYFHSLFGSRGWREGVARTGNNRTINREKLERAALERELADAGSRRHKIFVRYANLLRARTAHPAFNPYGAMKVLDAGPTIFALLRGESPGAVLCLQNVSAFGQTVERDIVGLLDSQRVIDLLTEQVLDANQARMLSPYQSRWFTCPEGNKEEQ